MREITDQNRFRGQMEGLEMERIRRDQEYSMTVRHFHKTYEFYYLLEGERYYFIDQETYLVKTGDVVFIHPEQIHKTSMAGNACHERILLQIQEEPLKPFLRACKIEGLEKLCRPGFPVLKISREESMEVKILLEQMEKELKRRQEHRSSVVRLLLMGLLLMISRFQEDMVWYPKPEIAQTWKHQKVHEVAQYLAGYPQTPETLPQLAARFYVSKSYLSRIFKEVTGFTVNEYKNISRIKKSQELLAGGNCSVTEIAEMLGYETVTYFERVFKRYNGTTPLKYRNQHKAGKS